MKAFDKLIEETLDVEDMEELEAAADLFDYGIENGSYTKRQVIEFNNTYWKVKNRILAYRFYNKSKGSLLDIVSIVSSAPSDIKDDEKKLEDYVNNRLKMMKGKVKV